MQQAIALESDSIDEAGASRPGRSSFLATFVENRLAVVGVTIVVFFILFCFVGPLIYHTNQVQTVLGDQNAPPSPQHWLGTDDVGYDVLGRLMSGGQTTLVVGIAVALIATCFGTIWGATAGYFGGLVDSIMMRTVDAALAIPPLFLLLFLASVVTPSEPILIIVISVIAWLAPARLVRSETLSLKSRDFVQACRVQGARQEWIILRHIIPNTLGTVIVNATFQVADAVLWVAALSFLGLAIPPPAANWGGMLSNGVNYVFDGYWWEIWPAGVCIVTVVLAFNFVGDGLRDAVEVRLRRR